MKVGWCYIEGKCFRDGEFNTEKDPAGEEEKKERRKGREGRKVEKGRPGRGVLGTQRGRRSAVSGGRYPLTSLLASFPYSTPPPHFGCSLPFHCSSLPAPSALPTSSFLLPFPFSLFLPLFVFQGALFAIPPIPMPRGPSPQGHSYTRGKPGEQTDT